MKTVNHLGLNSNPAAVALALRLGVVASAACLASCGDGGLAQDTDACAQLLRHIEARNEIEAVSMIGQGLDPNCGDGSALAMSLNKGLQRVATALIESGADVNLSLIHI